MEDERVGGGLAEGNARAQRLVEVVLGDEGLAQDGLDPGVDLLLPVRILLGLDLTKVEERKRTRE